MSNETLAIWEDIFKTRAWGKYPPLPLVRFIARNFYHMPDRKLLRMLEIGSGPGANLWYMAREGFLVHGIEGSATANAQALQYLEREKLADRVGFLKTGDYCEILHTLPDNYFHAIIDVESLYCNTFAASRAVVEIAVQKLKPGGKMFSMTFAEGTWGMDGPEVDYHATLPQEGPLAGDGFSRYVSEADIGKLYLTENTQITNIERHDRHLANQKTVREWVIEIERKA
jgi:SAM-dependent methyltransferase